MKKLNKKGFTLIEVLVAIVLITVLGGIAVPNVLKIINSGRDATEKVQVDNIKVAAQQLYEEVEFGSELKNYKTDGTTTNISINSNTITIYLQTLVMNGLLKGTYREEDIDKKPVLINPKTKKPIGDCQITIKKTVDSNYKTIYEISKVGSNSDCPNY